jgi:hypothetical protein
MAIFPVSAGRFGGDMCMQFLQMLMGEKESNWKFRHHYEATALKFPGKVVLEADFVVP